MLDQQCHKFDVATRENKAIDALSDMADTSGQQGFALDPERKRRPALGGLRWPDAGSIQISSTRWSSSINLDAQQPQGWVMNGLRSFSVAAVTKSADSNGQHVRSAISHTSDEARRR